MINTEATVISVAIETIKTVVNIRVATDEYLTEIDWPHIMGNNADMVNTPLLSSPNGLL